ncbi:hypothetical protein [Desulfovibrio legallii]|uniref:Uncharacterized protein n=1 Tax=Desulfovibrio legallii TaxID=571438 RepID=A0A1G7KKD8_9BACT|nr:hypothetical protein [Desulfovibrio legallii]SDF37420.1 hypothetical protein SAMN05192586_104136 [Desulfovibrio legallii]
MQTATKNREDAAVAAPFSSPFSPLGWSAGRRLALALALCALLWGVVWWAL